MKNRINKDNNEGQEHEHQNQIIKSIQKKLTDAY